jgi:ubiquinone/menaquinone biosynthesis C-methylase UbiE
MRADLSSPSTRIRRAAGVNSPAVRCYDRLARTYDGHFQRRLDRAEDAVLHRFVGEIDGLSVLDVGCGTGHFLDDRPDIRTFGYVGVDASTRMLGVAREKHPSHLFLLGLAEDLPHLEGDPYDLAICLWAFPYFQDGDAALREMEGAVQPGGTIIVMAYTRRYAARASHISGDEPLLMRYDSPASLTRSMLRAGLANVQVRPFRILGDRALAWWPQRLQERWIEHELERGRREPLMLIGTGNRAP